MAARPAIPDVRQSTSNVPDGRPARAKTRKASGPRTRAVSTSTRYAAATCFNRSRYSFRNFITLGAITIWQ